MLRSLEDEGLRSWALGLMQPTDYEPTTDWGRKGYDFVERLRSDPELRIVAERVGRLLPETSFRTLPPTFNPKG